MSETRILITLLQMYIPQNWEFGPAFSKLRNFGGFEPPNHPPGYASGSSCWFFSNPGFNYHTGTEETQEQLRWQHSDSILHATIPRIRGNCIRHLAQTRSNFLNTLHFVPTEFATHRLITILFSLKHKPMLEPSTSPAAALCATLFTHSSSCFNTDFDL
jgi:hypothetical protein